MIIFVCECMCMSKQRCPLMNAQRRNLSPLRANFINQYVYIYIRYTVYILSILNINNWPFCSPMGWQTHARPELHWCDDQSLQWANALGGSGVTLDQRFLADGMRVTGNPFCHFVRVVPQVPGIDGIITITTSVQCDSWSVICFLR